MLPAGGTKHQCPHESSPTHLFSLLIHIFFHAYFIHFRTRLLVKFYPFQHAVSFLSDLREVLGFWCCVRIEFSHWDAPGCDLGAKHGCWVNNRRRAHLQTRTPASTWNPLHCTVFNSQSQKDSDPIFVLHSNITQEENMTCVHVNTRLTHHKAEITGLHLFFHLCQNMRVQSFPKEHNVGPQQTAAVSFVAPWYSSYTINCVILFLAQNNQPTQMR